MFTISTIGVIFGLFVGAGALFDKLLLKHQKILIHNALYRWWFRLENTKIRNLYKLMAEYALEIAGMIFRWPLWSWQSFILLVILSWILTSIASLIGYHWTPQMHRISPIPLPIYTVYILNFPFDLLTCYATFHVLKIIRKANIVISILAIMIDILIAGILVCFCYGVIWWGSDLAFNNQSIGSEFSNSYFKQHFINNNKKVLTKDGFTEKATVNIYYKNSLLSYIKDGFSFYYKRLLGKYCESSYIIEYELIEGKKTKIYQAITIDSNDDWFRMITPLTTFVPTFFYMFILLFLLVGKFIIESAMHLLSVMTEPNPEKDPKEFIPGTLLGLLCGVIASLSKAIVEIFKTL